LERLIAVEGARRFYIGNEGAFDRMAYRVLRVLREKYPSISYSVVLAYIDSRTEAPWQDTVFPDELENVPPRFAIDRRNRWMIAHSHKAVVYVISPAGGAAKYSAIAQRRGVQVINLAPKQLK